MKTVGFALICTILAILPAPQGAFADDPAVAVLEETVKNLTAKVEALQFSNQQLQKDMESTRKELQEVRQAAGSVAAPDDLHKLDDRLQAEIAARQKDRQVIIDQLAKELASIKGGKPVVNNSGPSGPTTTDDSKEHIVAKGENLTAIAKSYGVTVAALRKANNLSTDDLKVGQKLTIPK